MSSGFLAICFPLYLIPLFFPNVSSAKYLKLRYLLCIRLVPFPGCPFAREVWWSWVQMDLGPEPVTDPLRASIHISKIGAVIIATSWSRGKNLVKLFPEIIYCYVSSGKCIWRLVCWQLYCSLGFFFCSHPKGLRNFSSLTRDQTWTLVNKSTES